MENTIIKKFQTSLGTLAYFDIGEGPAVVLFHGFPDTPLTFSHLVPVLNAAGYRCIVPFMPGYGESCLPRKADGPFKVTDASMLGIGKMIDEFLTSLVPGEAIKLIGHDWGSLLAQMLIALNDESPQAVYQIDQAVLYAVPPMGSFYRNLSLKQMFRSRYMMYFQGLGVAKTIRKAKLAYIKTLWQRWSPWTAEELEQQIQLKRSLQTLAEGRCLENGMAYYRHLLNPFYMLRGSSIIRQHQLLLKKRSCPCLLLVGASDECIGAEMFAGSEACYPHPDTQLMVLENLGHFAHLENPGKVNLIITDFLQAIEQKNPQAGVSA